MSKIKITRKLLLNLYIKQRLSAREIGRRTGWSNMYIGRQLRKFNISVRSDICGKNNPLYGKKHTKETRSKISKTRKKRIHLYPSLLGKNNPRYSGGISYTKEGYRKVLSNKHPNRDNNNYVKEHRLVMEKILGRYLERYEVVHHENNKKDDNRPENLFLFPSQNAHQAYHNFLKMGIWPKKNYANKLNRNHAILTK